MTTKADDKPLSLQVDFSASVSTGDETSAVGVCISRNRLSPTVALQKFCGKRIGVRIRVSPADGEDADQKHAPDDGYTEVEGHADVKRIGITPKDIGFRLVFSNGEIDKHALADFAATSGTLTVNSVEAIPEEEEAEEREVVKANGAPKANTTGKDEGIAQKLEILCKFEKGLGGKAIGNLIDAVNGETIGHLEHFMRQQGEFWRKNMAGIGQGTADRIASALEKFRIDFPMPDKTLFDAK